MVDSGRRFAWLLALFVALLLPTTTTPVLAQANPAMLTGSVLDPDSKAVVNAAVVVRSDTTGIVRAVSTDPAGRFSVDGIPAGPYVVEVRPLASRNRAAPMSSWSPGRR